MIKTIGDLLDQLIAVEKERLKRFSELNHPGMIGDIYEGLTIDLLRKTLIPGPDLRIVEGKMRRSDGELSRQLDCMIVRGEGEPVPYTKHWIYPVNQVVAVLEVKKTLFASDLDDALDLMAHVHDRFYEIPSDLPSDLLRDAWRSIRGTELPIGDELEQLSVAERILRVSLFKNAVLPVRIVLGFDGYKSEATLRTGFAKALWKKVNGPSRATVTSGPAALPDLIVGRTAALIKLNGMPYPGPYSVSEKTWDLFGSTGHHPMRTLLEVLWTRLTYYHGVPTSIFGEDLELDKVNRLLTAQHAVSARGRGWKYEFLNVPDKILPEGPDTVEWMPAVVTKEAFAVLSILCEGNEASSDDEGLKVMLAESRTSLAQLSAELSEARLAFLDADGKFRLLTTSCQIAFIPGLGCVAADDNTGRFSRWMARWLDQRNRSGA